MTAISWRGGNGEWSTPTDWSGFSQPTADDSVLMPVAAAGYTVTLDSAGFAASVSVDAAGGALATLDLTGTLTLGGTLGGAGSLDLAGLLSGGALDLTQLRVSGSGTLEGVTVLGSLAGLDGVTLDAATALASATVAGGTLALPAQATLLGGSYGAATLLLGLGAGSAALTAAGTVTLGAHTVLDLFQDPGLYPLPESQGAVALAGDVFVNQGTILSDFSTQAGATLAITASGFSNAGMVDFQPLQSSQNGSFVVGFQTVHGNQEPIYGLLDWTQAFAETVAVTSEQFDNSGQFLVQGGSLVLAGAGTFDNSGSIWLSEASGQTVVSSGGIASVASVALPTFLEIGAGYTSFDNTGTLAADTIEFDGAVALARLGTLKGALTFVGTLDLAGGTLDASGYASVTISGTVENGTLRAGSGTLSLDGATIANSVVRSGGNLSLNGPITLLDPPGGTPVTLDAVVTTMDLSAGGSSDATVVAGSALVTDTIQLQSPGTATLRSGFSLAADVAGSTVDIAGAAGGSGVVVLGGHIAVDAATVVVSATLDGSGTLSLADGAAVTLEALAATALTHVQFGAGPALLVLPGSGALGVVLGGLQPGDVVDFAAISSVPAGPFGTGGAAPAQGTLFVTGASGDTANVALAGSAAGLAFHVVPDGAGGSLVQVDAACFARGTRLATPGGERAVETLRPGDTVLTAAGRIAPVRWVGCTAFDLGLHPAPARVAPVRIAAGAVAAGVPSRDLWVSPDHCLFIDGALIPAAQLRNGASIFRDDSFAQVEYWHIELDRHDLLLAEGLPTESYLDTGNRALFAGQAGVRMLHPDLSGPPDAAALRLWASHGCAPLRQVAEDVRARLRARLERDGWQVGRAAALSLLAGGRAVAWQDRGEAIAAMLPAGTSALRIVSDSFVPRELLTGSGDERRLGLAVSAALLAGWPLHQDAFAAGWHAPAGEDWRWSDGDARLVFPRLARPTPLLLRLGARGMHWQAPSCRKMIRAA